MKKLFVVLAILLGVSSVAVAQKGFVQLGVGTQSSVFTQDVKLGIQNGKNQFAVVGEFSNPTHKADSTIYYAGVEYGRMFNAGGKNSIVALGAAKIHLNKNTYDLVVEPGLGYNLNLGSGISLQPSVSFPFNEGSTIGKDVSIKAGIGLQIGF